MKKVNYIIMVLSAWLTACVSDDNAFDSTLQDIDFQAVINSTKTRAGENVFDTQKTFGAYAWIGESNITTNETPYIVNKEVHNVSSVWSFVSPCYWPMGNSFLDFFCYAPFDASNPKPTVTVTGDFNTNKIAYTNIVADANTPDYMYSNKVPNQTKETNPGGVPIIFNHALAKVKFGIRLSAVDNGKTNAAKVTYSVRLKEFTLTNITNKGSVELGLHDDKQKWIKPNPAIWKEAASADAKVDWNMLPTVEAEKLLTTNDLKPLKDVMVIPQALEDAMKLTIRYDLISTKGTSVTTEEKTISIMLNSIQSSQEAIKNWEMNKIISYNVVINPPSDLYPLNFSPEVKDWITNDSSIEVSPK